MKKKSKRVIWANLYFRCETCNKLVKAKDVWHVAKWGIAWMQCDECKKKGKEPKIFNKTWAWR